MMIRYRMLLVGGVAGISSMLGCVMRLPDHCANLMGDETCRQQGGGYCSSCELANNGCVDGSPGPGNECHVSAAGTSGEGTAERPIESMTEGLDGDAGTTRNPGTGSADGSTTLVLDDTGGADASGTAENEGVSESTMGTPIDETYPSCQGGCPNGFGQCYDYIPGYDMCTHVCAFAGQCRQPISGSAVVECPFGFNRCVLDCSGGTICPDGMDCVEWDLGAPVGVVQRCVWPI